MIIFQADAIRVKVGYPVSPNTESAWAIYRYYALVLIDEDKLMENVLSSWYELSYILPPTVLDTFAFQGERRV